MVREPCRILQGCAPGQSDGFLGRGIQRGKMPWSSHHRRAITSIACRSKVNHASRCAGRAASVSLKRRKGLRCCNACRSARARRASPHCSAKSSMISKTCDDSIGSTHSHRSLSRGSSVTSSAASGPPRNRSSPDSRWSQWLLSPNGSREFSAQISSSRSMANQRAAPSLRSGGLSFRAHLEIPNASHRNW